MKRKKKKKRFNGSVCATSSLRSQNPADVVGHAGAGRVMQVLCTSQTLKVLSYTTSDLLAVGHSNK